MAIRKERYATSDGRELVRTYSDDGKKIVNEAGVVYDDAIDQKGHGHRYSETDEKVDVALEHPMNFTGRTYIGTDDPDEPTMEDRDAALRRFGVEVGE